jgi:hypothetical protein
LFDRKLAMSGEWECIPILEVVMRRPDMFVKSLSDPGGRVEGHVDTSGASVDLDPRADLVGVQCEEAVAADRRGCS